MLKLAGSRRAEELVRKAPFTKGMVERFVAGEDATSVLKVAAQLDARGLGFTLDLLGENAKNVETVDAAGRAYLALLDSIAEAELPVNISIKLTMLGLDTSDDAAWQRMEPIVSRARQLGGFVRIDMEGSDYTERTLSLFRRIHDLYPESVGIVLQSYLYRTDLDLEEMLTRKARVRIVKGAYKEPELVAYPEKHDVDDAYRRHITRLLESGTYPAIATHDRSMLEYAKGQAAGMGRAPDSYEFQMLFGIGREEQESLARAGYRVRVYIPYGTSWYPYFMRRLAERPANLLFIVKNLFR